MYRNTEIQEFIVLSREGLDFFDYSVLSLFFTHSYLIILKQLFVKLTCWS